jgi:hypothetical protein
MNNKKAMTSNNFFIPTLTDVVEFADIVPVLTDRAEDDDHHDHEDQVLVLASLTPITPITPIEPIEIDTPVSPIAVEHENANQPTTIDKTPVLASDMEALSQQLWVALEPEFKKILQETVLTFFEQQQATLIDTLGAKIRPLLVQTLETHPMGRASSQVNSMDKNTNPHSNNPSQS